MGGYVNGSGVISRILRNSGAAGSLCKLGIAGFFLSFSIAAVIAAEQFLRPDATYVLITGIPGDLESESTYRDQMQTWLEMLEHIRPKRVIALADNPDTVGLAGRMTTNTSLTVLASSRSNFLAASSLISSTNPVVVIVWGHGGRQGSTPVFHVRGPRITPADLSAFSEKIGAIESCWILSFRGSGSFASKLAGKRRQILSSESDTIFNSDPVEMSLMQKIAHESPTISFEAFVESLGRAIAAWYKERNLARTEEPTLWLENQRPGLLAASSEQGALASIAPQTPNSSIETTNETPKSITNNAVTDVSAADLPATWKELKRVDPRDYPEADAIMLRRRISYTLAVSPAVVAEHDEFIQILTTEGKRFGDFDISYAPPFEDITFSDCEVLSPQGKLARLDPDAIREANDESLGDYQAGRRKFFSLPGVVPGAILHVHYHNEWKKFPLPHISLEISVSGELPALESALQVTVPKDEPFHFALENVSGPLAVRGSSINPDPTIKQTSYGASYTWQFTNLVGESREILAPPRQGIALLLSTFPDWADFAEWYARISKLTDEVTPEIKAKAAELTHESKTDREKILSVYNYVTSLRYVAIPLGVNSFRPHSAGNVLKNQFGDCKDKANLFNTMLRSLNIDAHLVLVPRFRQAYDELPGLAFNHAISRVTLPDETLWADTTDDVCRFGMLPPGDSARKVLVIAERTNSLTQLPSPHPDRHKLTVRAEIDCSHGFDALPASFEAVAFGYPDYELRESARGAKEHAEAVPFLSARYRISAGSFALQKQTATPVAALERDFSWSAQGSVIGAVSTFSDKPANSDRALLRPSFWLPKEWELALNHRKSALFLNQGYPLTLNEQVDFTLPAQSQVAALPVPAENAQGPLKWKVEWTKPAEARLRATLHAELSTGELPGVETVSLQQQLRALITAVNTGTAFNHEAP
jgi:hypothetical protein